MNVHNWTTLTQNKTAIITGSSRGIGKETAIQLADNVRNLVVCSRNQHEINSVVKEIENINNQVNVLGSKCDVRESSQVNSLVQSTIDRFGSESIDILVNNAGVAFDKKLVDTSEEEWDQTMDTNLKGAFLISSRSSRNRDDRANPNLCVLFDDQCKTQSLLLGSDCGMSARKDSHDKFNRVGDAADH